MKAIQSQMVRLKSETNATVDGYHNGRTKRENQNTWRVDFPNDSRTYVIEFKTSVDEKLSKVRLVMTIPHLIQTKVLHVM